MEPPSRSSPGRRFPKSEIGYFKDAIRLCCLDFPIYYVESISERHVLVAGGGGSSKTGVHNQINIIELVPDKESCSAELETKHLTPEDIPDAIMTGSIMFEGPSRVRFVTGGFNSAVIYEIKLGHSCSIQEIHRFPTSTSTKMEIKSVKCVEGGKILTGGTDGKLTLWDTNSNNECVIIKSFVAHSKEIDEIDVNLPSNQFITLSRGECRSVLWKLDDCSMIKEYKKDLINQNNSPDSTNTLRYRSCRFIQSSNNSESSIIFACNPTLTKKCCLLQKCYIQNGQHKTLAAREVKTDAIMSMNVSKDGEYLAIGSRSGQILMFDTKSMKQIYGCDRAHHNVITGIEFLPPKQESYLLANSQLNPFISVSIDRQIVLHRPRKYRISSGLILLLLTATMISFAFSFVYNCIP